MHWALARPLRRGHQDRGLVGVPAALGDFAWGSLFNVQSQRATGSRTCGPLKEKGPRAPDHEALSPGTLETQEHQRPAAHGTARGPPGGRVRGATTRPGDGPRWAARLLSRRSSVLSGRETTGHVTGVWAQPPPVSRRVPVTGEASRPEGTPWPPTLPRPAWAQQRGRCAPGPVRARPRPSVRCWQAHVLSAHQGTLRAWTVQQLDDLILSSPRGTGV